MLFPTSPNQPVPIFEIALFIFIYLRSKFPQNFKLHIGIIPLPCLLIASSGSEDFGFYT